MMGMVMSYWSMTFIRSWYSRYWSGRKSHIDRLQVSESDISKGTQGGGYVTRSESYIYVIIMMQGNIII